MRRGSKLGPEHRRKFVAGGRRSFLNHRNKMAKLASGGNEGPRNHTGATIEVSPAAWLGSRVPIGDCEFLDDGLDDILLRAVHDRVVYAGSVTSHRSPPFGDVSIRAIAAAVNGKVANLFKEAA